MSEREAAEADPASDEQFEEVDALPVLAGERPVVTRSGFSPVVVQAAAVAATGFVAGAATVAVLRRRQTRRALPARRSTRHGDGLPVVGSRSFLVDVHLLGRPLT